MNDQLANTLYNTLNGFVAHTWEVVATQVYISTVYNMVISLLLVVGVGMGIRFFYRRGTVVPEGLSYPVMDKDLMYGVITALIVVSIFVVLPYFLVSLDHLITLFLNPEYMVLEWISDLLPG
jgi:hypothetical protein